MHVTICNFCVFTLLLLCLYGEFGRFESFEFWIFLNSLLQFIIISDYYYTPRKWARDREFQYQSSIPAHVQRNNLWVIIADNFKYHKSLTGATSSSIISWFIWVLKVNKLNFSTSTFLILKRIIIYQKNYHYDYSWSNSYFSKFWKIYKI